MGLRKDRKVAGFEAPPGGSHQYYRSSCHCQTGPACPAAAGAEFDQIQLTGQDITDSAGVPRGSFYNHIGSKEALAVVALQRYAERRRLEDLADPSAAPGAPARPLRAASGQDGGA